MGFKLILWAEEIRGPAPDEIRGLGVEHVPWSEAIHCFLNISAGECASCSCTRTFRVKTRANYWGSWQSECWGACVNTWQEAERMRIDSLQAKRESPPPSSPLSSQLPLNTTWVSQLSLHCAAPPWWPISFYFPFVLCESPTQLTLKSDSSLSVVGSETVSLPRTLSPPLHFSDCRSEGCGNVTSCSSWGDVCLLSQFILR